ncbi:MAG: biopolymer transporter ExbD [Candidatus Hatepunaea meridiana]|nr:biopolymer transporter ExbD [Candidatus Hatepunaea meridiana]
MAFAPSKSKKNPKKKVAPLSLNSMMDMMTIILLFLLKSMSTSAELIQPSEFLELPKAAREAKPKKALSLLITNELGVVEDMEANPNQICSIDELDNPDNQILPGLEAYLSRTKEFEEKAGIPFKGEVTIQCDKLISYEWLLKVINTCGQQEYATIEFIVIKEKQS